MKKITTLEEVRKAIVTQGDLSKRDLVQIPITSDIEVRLNRALEYIDILESKYFDLVWYARKKEEDYKIPGVKKASDRIESQYKDSIEDLNNEPDWQHGFNSGMLAACRLFSGMMNKEFIEEQELNEYELRDDLYLTDDGVPVFIYDDYQDSIDDFPNLDT